MTTSDPHLDRARAESFGTVAQQYDRYRPPHAERLIDDLAALAPARVLDIACGTGKAAVALAGRGLDVLGVETDERMAQVARAHGVPVEIAPFETWDARGRRFGLVTCGSAWHWIDPALGAAKVADLLHPGGTFARFWSYHVLDGAVRESFDEIYRRLGPPAHAHGHAPDGGVDPLAGHDAFSPVEERRYRRDLVLSADDWLGLVSTFSDHQRLDPEQLAALTRELRATIEAAGGRLHARLETIALFTRRRPEPGRT